VSRSSFVLDLTHGLEPGRLNVDVDGDVRAASSGDGAVPMLLAGGEDDGIARVDILSGFTLSLDADSALDDEQPLRTRMAVPVRSSAVREAHAVDANRHRPLILCKALNGGRSDKRRRIDRQDRC